ncbi:MAG: LuxR family transcriptional regulator [Proteobacteria bacterium]|nr:LuxR family transcriptional regulator [Pseudomonadota bacterium]
MVIKIACTDKNYFFRLGISKIIDESILSVANVEFLSNFDSQSLQQADLIVVNASQWRLYMCQTAYRDRKPGSIMLVFVDKSEDFITYRLPLCYRSLAVVSRADSVSKVAKKITKNLFNFRNGFIGYLPSDCLRCNFSNVTMVQLRVINYLKKGHSVNQAAMYLGMNNKTVYSHKYDVMRKFSLKGDFEFNSFINDLTLSEIYNGRINHGEI